MIEYAGYQDKVKVILGNISTDNELFRCTDSSSGSASDSRSGSSSTPPSSSSASSNFNSSAGSGSGSSSGSISGFKEMLERNHGSSYLDVLFIDHDKSKYLSDLKIIESCDLLQSGTEE